MSNEPILRVKRLPHADGLPLPFYATAGAAGMDLHAAVFDPVTIHPQRRALISTGLSVAVPAGYEMQIRSRSGLALKAAVIVLNAPGTIDSDYRGDVAVILFNAGTEPFTVNRGDRIAQAVVAPVVRAAWVEVDDLDATERGDGGFGSTDAPALNSMSPSEVLDWMDDGSAG